jgi:hypothetical protein
MRRRDDHSIVTVGTRRGAMPPCPHTPSLQCAHLHTLYKSDSRNELIHQNVTTISFTITMQRKVETAGASSGKLSLQQTGAGVTNDVILCQQVRGKVVSVLFLTEHHAMKAYRGSGGIAHAFFTSALDGAKWSVSCPCRFTPRERAPGTQWIGGWVGPRAGLDTVVKRKIPSPAGTRTPDHPARSSGLYTTELSIAN